MIYIRTHLDYSEKHKLLFFLTSLIEPPAIVVSAPPPMKEFQHNIKNRPNYMSLVEQSDQI